MGHANLRQELIRLGIEPTAENINKITAAVAVDFIGEGKSGLQIPEFLPLNEPVVYREAPQAGDVTTADKTKNDNFNKLTLPFCIEGDEPNEVITKKLYLDFPNGGHWGIIHDARDYANRNIKFIMLAFIDGELIDEQTLSFEELKNIVTAKREQFERLSKGY